MANTVNQSINVLATDFSTIRSQLVSYLQTYPQFRNADFEGANWAVILDILALNSFQNSFYGNMIASETFLDSAQTRSAVISNVKPLNYLPRSNQSASANINLTITTSDGSTSAVIPKYTSFTARSGSNNFSFSTNSAISAISSNNIITANNIQIYEGILSTDQFVFSANSGQRFILSNPNIDTSSLFVAVIEDGGSTLYTYTQASSLFGLNANSTVYFLQAATNGNYELVFGDNVSGRTPKNGAIISAEYRISSGSFANSISQFTPDDLIDGQSNVIVTVNSGSTGGSFAESIASIKFNAPRHFATQERAITEADYESLLLENFPEIFAVSATGGEDLTPPQFGKTLITVALNGISSLPQSKIQTYSNFLQPYMGLSNKPIFGNPSYIYVGVTSEVNYNINTSGAEPSTISTEVQQVILNYSNQNLNNFKVNLRYSPLCTQIDSADSSIISNETTLSLIQKIIPTPGISATYTLNYNQELLDIVANGYCLTSSFFYYNNQLSLLQDDGNGNINITSTSGSILQKNIGTINYNSGLVVINNLIISLSPTNYLKIYVTPLNKDLYSNQSVIMLISQEDISITVNPVAE